jgi:hypothetical protein
MKKLLLAAAATLAFSSGANAAREHSVIWQEIKFKKGEYCWSYTGEKSEFVGRFQPFQLVTINAYATTQGTIGGKVITNAEVKVIGFYQDHHMDEIKGPNYYLGDVGPVDLTIDVNYPSLADEERITHILICTSDVE